MMTITTETCQEFEGNFSPTTLISAAFKVNFSLEFIPPEQNFQFQLEMRFFLFFFTRKAEKFTTTFS